MKKITLILIALLIQGTASAHYLWIETSPVAKLNEEHLIKVRFGEYTYGAIEKPGSEAFNGVKNFKLWLVSPSGMKMELKTTPGEEFYQASFVPLEKGSYTIALNNEELEVLDYTEYDFGIFKPQYHAKARVTVGDTPEAITQTNANGIEIINLSPKIAGKNNEVKLKVIFKGQPIADQEVVIYISDLWSKKVITDKNGEVNFSLPWDDTLYTVESTYNENVPGKYKQKNYEFIWHCATYAIAI
jgi:uncharacterized GH25 family protein